MFQELCEGMYFEGECYAFAIALRQGLGWPIVGLMHKGVVRHAVVRKPEDGTLFDARGPITEIEELGRPFQVPQPYELRELKEDDLLAIRPVHERSIARARDIAEKIWPDLPWNDSSLARARQFAQELEALSRKYDIWLRAPVPATPPILVVAEGDEGGYTLSPSLNALYTIDRILTDAHA